MIRRLSPFLLALIMVPLAPAAHASPAAPLANETPEFVALLKKVADQLNGQDVYDCIQQIHTDAQTAYRLMGTPSSTFFLQKYSHVFSAVSPRFKDQVVHFANGGPTGTTTVKSGGDNIIGVLPGKNLTKWVVMGGHYDTQAATIGAIDNTSGICTVLQVAKMYAKLDLQPDATVVFAWWDGEEWGLYGSTNFVKDHRETSKLLGLDPATPITILSGTSFDIVGINYPAFNTCPCYGDPANVMEYALLNLRTPPTVLENFSLGSYKNVPSSDHFEDTLANFTRFTGLVKEINWGLFGLPWKYVDVRDDEYGRSDQVPFTAAGIPGLRVQGSHDAEWPHYHQPTDTLPAAITMAGGLDKLVAGFNTAIDAGGTTAAYISLKGDLGNYGGVTAQNASAPATTAALKNNTPGFLGVLALGALGVVALRRRD